MAERAPNGTSIGGYVDPNFPNPNGPEDIPIIIYGYTPSIALAAFAAALFACSLVLHAWQVARHRTWWFVVVPVALGFEIVGYVARSLSSKVDPYNLIFFILNYFFIVTAPVFLSAGLYAVLCVLLLRRARRDADEPVDHPTGTRKPGLSSPLPPRVILAVFVTSDVLTTAMQITGAAIIGAREGAREDPDLGNNILLAGLCLQAASMAIFCMLLALILWRAWRRSLSSRNENSHDNNKAEGLGVTRIFLAVFVVATLMVYLRTCFRLAETAQNIGGYLATHEVFFATLEFAPIALAVLLLNIWHPGRYLPKVVEMTAVEAPARTSEK